MNGLEAINRVAEPTGQPHMIEDIVRRLDEIEDRRKIEDVIFRYCRAMDRNDLELFRSVFWEDGGFGHGVPSSVAKDFAGPLMTAMAVKYEATSHFVGNILIDLRADHAFVESYAVVHHKSHPTPESNESVLGSEWLEDGNIDPNVSHDLVIGVRYSDQFRKRSGTWRIAVRNLIFDWSQVQPNNFRNFGSFNPSSLCGKRGSEDPSYLRELCVNTI